MPTLHKARPTPVSERMASVDLDSAPLTQPLPASPIESAPWSSALALGGLGWFCGALLEDGTMPPSVGEFAFVLSALLVGGLVAGSVVRPVLLWLRGRTSAAVGLVVAALIAGVTFGSGFIATMALLDQAPALQPPYLFGMFWALFLVEIPTIATEHAANRSPRLASILVGLIAGAVTVLAF